MRRTQDIEASPELLREYISQQRCWICGKNGWKALSMHLLKKHGLPAAQVREMAYMYKRERLISKELSDHFATTCLSKFGAKHWVYDGKRQKTRELSTKRRNECRIIADNMRPLAAESMEQFRKPHPCPICGKMIPMARPIHCSEECVAQARSDASRQSMTPERIEQFKGVIYKPTPEEQSTWARGFWQEFRTRPQAEQQEFLLRRAAPLKRPRIEKPCVICGSLFYLTPYQAKRQYPTQTCDNPSCRTTLMRRHRLGRRHTEASKKKMSEHAIRRHQIEGGRFGH